MVINIKGVVKEQDMTNMVVVRVPQYPYYEGLVLEVQAQGKDVGR